MGYKIVLISIMHKNNFKELLLVKRKRHPGMGMWSLPGGVEALENEKDPFKAILYEVYTDFSVKFTSHFYTLKFGLDPDPTLYLYFHGEIVGEPRIREDTKTIKEMKWFPIDEILRMNLAFEEKDKPIIRRFKDNFLPRSDCN